LEHPVTGARGSRSPGRTGRAVLNTRGVIHNGSAAFDLRGPHGFIDRERREQKLGAGDGEQILVLGDREPPVVTRGGAVETVAVPADLGNAQVPESGVELLGGGELLPGRNTARKVHEDETIAHVSWPRWCRSGCSPAPKRGCCSRLAFRPGTPRT